MEEDNVVEGPRPEDAVAFLKAFVGRREDKRVHLTAIEKYRVKGERKDRSAIKSGVTFDRAEDAKEWIVDQQRRGYNCYFAINPLKADVRLGETLRPNKDGKLVPMLKASKEDVAAVTHLQVDMDYTPYPGLLVADILQRMLDVITAIEPVASWYVYSGNGFWGFWELDEPALVDGKDGPLTLGVEARSRGIEEAVGKAFADNCHNIDRIARLPGTINSKGLYLAKVVGRYPDAIYDVGRFPQVHKSGAAASAPPTEDALPTYNIGDLGLDPATIELIRNGKEDEDQSRLLYLLTCKLIRAGVPDAVVLAVMVDPVNRGFIHVEKHPNRYEFVKRQLAQIIGDIGRPGPILPREDHYRRARRFIESERPNLKRYRDDWYDFRDGSYSKIDDLDVKSEVARWLERSLTRRNMTPKGPVVVIPFCPDINLIGQTLDAIRNAVTISSDLEIPAWLDDRKEPDPHDLVFFPNTTLVTSTRVRLEPDPALFSIGSLAFDYGEKTGAPNWEKFLDEIFNRERDQIDTLHEIMGYMLTSDTSIEKVFGLIGPKRGGKGTISRMQSALMVSNLIAGPALRDLSTNFGLEPLIGKRLAIVDDVRIDGIPKGARGTMAENILKIAGNGLFTIDRKNKSKWTGRLNLKLLLISNVLPSFGDTSGAAASRFIFLQTKRSFYGTEDPRLFRDKLFPERLGVLHLALEGLDRLRERGHFVETETSIELRRTMENTGSDIKAFIDQECELDPEAVTPKLVVYDAYNGWLRSMDLPIVIPDEFAKQLYAAEPTRVFAIKTRSGGERVPSFRGIRLKAQGEADM